jgi:hypothetical protein
MIPREGTRDREREAETESEATRETRGKPLRDRDQFLRSEGPLCVDIKSTALCASLPQWPSEGAMAMQKIDAPGREVADR